MCTRGESSWRSILETSSSWTCSDLLPEIKNVVLEEELQSSYLDYAMSVIIGRAIPDARDGIKPVQRRILYAMYRIGNTHDKPTKKSATVVGEVIGHFHPHGDIPIYDALVRMAQPFAMNHVLVEGQGNFGSIDGDPPAAMRYTEVRLARLADELLADLDKETVKFLPNFDNTEKEPEILPAKLPNLLVNGAAGIAVGVATSIPPHNLSEVCDAVLYMLDHKEASADELMEIIKGPDFPTGGIAIMSQNAANGYKYGRGQLTVRGKAAVDAEKGRIAITEIPYNVNKAAFVENVANLARDRIITGIRDIRDESDRHGINIVIELTRDANAEQILNQLYKHTQLETTFPLISLAVMGKVLKSFSITQLLSTFINYRREIVTKRSQFELNVAKDRLHIVMGLQIAVAQIDRVVKTIRDCKEIGEARAMLMAHYSLSEKQANAILDMKLSRLTQLENRSLEKEANELNERIKRYTEVLADPSKIDGIIKEETLELKKKYGRPRRTEIVRMEQQVEIQDEDLISDEEVSIILTNSGYVKRMSVASYKAQDRGGKGIIAMNLKEGDFVKQMTTAMNKDYILCVSNLGRIYWLKAYSIPEGSRYSEGRSIANLLNLQNESIVAIFNIKDFSKAKIAFLTQKGLVKKISAELFSRPRVTGVRAITLNDGDSIADAIVYTSEPYLIVATRNGKSIKFSENDVRATGRAAAGVRGIRLKDNDSAKEIIAARDSGSVLTVSEKGYGKITEIGEYRAQGRGGSGVINLKVNEKTGHVAKVLFVTNEQKLLLISSKGVSIMIPIASIRVTGRAASGVRLMKLEPGAKVIDAKLMEEEATQVNTNANH
jgi:DNA gyrase subunit A